MSFFVQQAILVPFTLIRMNDYHKYTDEQLFGLLQQRDENAFHEVYQRYHHIVYGFVAGYIQHPHHRQAALRNIFCELWSTKAQYLINISFTDYLFRICLRSIVRDNVYIDGGGNKSGHTCYMFFEELLSKGGKDLPEGVVSSFYQGLQGTLNFSGAAMPETVATGDYVPYASSVHRKKRIRAGIGLISLAVACLTVFIAKGMLCVKCCHGTCKTVHNSRPCTLNCTSTCESQQ